MLVVSLVLPRVSGNTSELHLRRPPKCYDHYVSFFYRHPPTNHLRLPLPEKAAASSSPTMASALASFVDSAPPGEVRSPDPTPSPSTRKLILTIARQRLRRFAILSPPCSRAASKLTDSPASHSHQVDHRRGPRRAVIVEARV